MYFLSYLFRICRQEMSCAMDISFLGEKAVLADYFSLRSNGHTIPWKAKPDIFWIFFELSSWPKAHAEWKQWIFSDFSPLRMMYWNRAWFELNIVPTEKSCGTVLHLQLFQLDMFIVVRFLDIKDVTYMYDVRDKILKTFWLY